MLQSFIIVLREGFEAFLIIGVILAYLRKTGQQWLASAVYWAVAASVAVSVYLGYLLNTGIDQSFWEGVLGVVAIIMVASLVIHMWRTAPQLKKKMERRLEQASSTSSRVKAFLGVFFFTVLMISREGMETALMLIQVHTSQWVLGALGCCGGDGVDVGARQSSHQYEALFPSDGYLPAAVYGTGGDLLVPRIFRIRPFSQQRCYSRSDRVVIA